MNHDLRVVDALRCTGNPCSKQALNSRVKRYREQLAIEDWEQPTVNSSTSSPLLRTVLPRGVYTAAGSVSSLSSSSAQSFNEVPSTPSTSPAQTVIQRMHDNLYPSTAFAQTVIRRMQNPSYPSTASAQSVADRMPNPLSLATASAQSFAERMLNPSPLATTSALSFTERMQSQTKIRKEMGKKSRRSGIRVNRENFTENMLQKARWGRFTHAHKLSTIEWKKSVLLKTSGGKGESIRSICRRMNNDHLRLPEDYVVSVGLVHKYVEDGKAAREKGEGALPK